MVLSLPRAKLTVYLTNQFAHAFPDGKGPGTRVIASVVADALDTAEHCFSRIAVKYFSKEGQPRFNHLNSDQYAMFLYWVSRFAHERGKTILAEKAYCLNKMMHGLDVFYEVQLPKVFFFCHMIGTVLGRAGYGEYLTVFQGVTVGGNHGIYPVFGKHVTLLGNCSVVGKSQIGENTIVGANTMVKDQDVGPNQIVLAGDPQIYLRPNTNVRYRNVFK